MTRMRAPGWLGSISGRIVRAQTIVSRRGGLSTGGSACLAGLGRCMYFQIAGGICSLAKPTVSLQAVDRLQLPENFYRIRINRFHDFSASPNRWFIHSDSF
jgi:hypothetical protein